MARHEHLPKELKHLAWLSLEDADGQEYWAAMNLMGLYAAANHALIHRHIARKLGLMSSSISRTITTSPGRSATRSTARNAK
jgi:RNA-splicing ligase RtcB